MTAHCGDGPVSCSTVSSRSMALCMGHCRRQCDAPSNPIRCGEARSMICAHLYRSALHLIDATAFGCRCAKVPLHAYERIAHASAPLMRVLALAAPAPHFVVATPA